MEENLGRFLAGPVLLGGGCRRWAVLQLLLLAAVEEKTDFDGRSSLECRCPR